MRLYTTILTIGLAVMLSSSTIQEPETVERGIGFQDFKIGESSMREVRSIMHKLTKASYFKYKENKLNLTSLHYEEHGVIFQFGGKSTSNPTLQYIYLFEPFQGITKEGIQLGKHCFSDVEEVYGSTPWQVSGKDLYKEYDGIIFMASLDHRIPVDELKNQREMTYHYRRKKITKIILTEKKDKS